MWLWSFFVRKRLPEIQYLRIHITDQQRQEFGRLVAYTIAQVESGSFLPRPGVRFPQNGCVSCPYLGLCIGDQNLVENKLVRRPGAIELAWLDELE